MKVAERKVRQGDNTLATQSIELPLIKWTIITVLSLAVLLALTVGGCAGCKAYHRYQVRQDAENAVKVAGINAQKEHNNIQVAKQHAKQAIAEARGIRKSQEIINATLTPLYLQHEAIKAQERMANSPNHTQIYIPSGSNGIPLINDLGSGQAAAK